MAYLAGWCRDADQGEGGRSLADAVRECQNKADPIFSRRIKGRGEGGENQNLMNIFSPKELIISTHICHISNSSAFADELLVLGLDRPQLCSPWKSNNRS